VLERASDLAAAGATVGIDTIRVKRASDD